MSPHKPPDRFREVLWWTVAVGCLYVLATVVLPLAAMGGLAWLMLHAVTVAAHALP